MMREWLFLVAVFALALSGGAAAQPLEGGTIQRRLDALGETGGTVRLKAGTYLIGSTLRLGDNVTLQGAGMDKTVLRLAPGVNAPVLMTRNSNENEAPQGNHDITLRDFTVDANGAENPGLVSGAICLPNCYNYRIERLRVTRSRGVAGIYTNPCHAARARGVPYQNFIVNCIVEGNRPAHDRDAPYGHGIYITAWDNENVLVSGNVCRNNAGSGIHLEDGVKFIFVIGNECTNNRQYGLWLCRVSDSVVIGNRLRGNLRGMMVNYAGTNLLIADNEVEANRLEGMYFGTPGFAKPEATYQVPEPSRCMVVANLVRNNNQAYQDAGAGLYCEWRGNLFAHNAIYDDQEEPTQFIGLWLAAPDNVALHNYLRPQAYRSRGEYLCSVEGENTLVPFDYEKPWTPQNLVGRKSATWTPQNRLGR